MPEDSDSDHIGRIGEDWFQSLANKARLLVGKIDPDRVGKDRIVEFQLADRDEHQSFDKRPPPLKCGVQIKSIKARNNRISIALSVAERLIGDPHPIFIAIPKIDQRDEVVSLGMIHLLGKPLARVLKRLREEYAKGTKKLNQRSITFAFSEADMIDREPVALIAYLREAIGDDMASYAVTKEQQRTTVGYDPETHITFQTTFEEIDSAEFVRGLLGLRPLPVANLRMFEDRFDIRLEDTRWLPKDLVKMTVEVSPVPQERGIVTIRDLKTFEEVDLPCDIILPAIRSIPFDQMMIRARTEFLEIIVGGGRIDFSGRGEIDSNEPHLLSDWIGLLKATKIFLGANCEFRLKSSLGPVVTGISREPPKTADDDVVKLLPLLLRFQTLRKEAGASDEPISLTQVFEARQFIDFVHALFEGKGLNGPWSWTMELIDEDDPATQHLFLFVHAFLVGSQTYAYAATVEMTGEVDSENGQKVFWSSSSYRALAIEPVQNDDEFHRFRHRMTRVSGCAFVVAPASLQDLAVNEVSDREAEA